MPKVYISYRRDDSEDVALRIYDALVAQYGIDNVIIDLTIAPGVDFRAYLYDTISQSDVVLAVIGPKWATPTPEYGRRRLDNSDDFVRIELEQALRDGIPVIPVLFAGGRIPPAAGLPPSLVPLTVVQSTSVGDDSFSVDMVRLVASIDAHDYADVEHSLAAHSAITPGDDDFQVTAFHAKEVKVDTFENMLLVYAHIVSALKDVRKDALNFKHLLGERSKTTSSGTIGPIPRGTEISLIPKLSGVRFDPESVSFKWAGDWHRAIFRFQPSPELSGDVARGEIGVYATTDAGRLLISRVRLAMSFEELPTDPLAPEAWAHPTAESNGFRFQSIFASYAHEDIDIVRDCCRAYQALGITMHIDYLSLLSGQYFDTAIMKLIESSDLFQLYWSPRAAASSWVRKEWEYALTCDREEGFIRPLFWEEPLPTVPLGLGRLHFARLE